MNTQYSMSFTSGTLLLRESQIVVDLYESLGDWTAARDAVVADNLLQMRTRNASERVCREVVSRLKLLTPEQRQLLRDGSPQEQRYLLWLAVCKRYRFIYEFAVEVVREKYLLLDLALPHSAYEAFFENKAALHDEVERVAESTRAKQRQVVFKMLREADLLSQDDQIIPALLTPRLIEAISRDAPAHLAVFPVSELLIQESMRS